MCDIKWLGCGNIDLIWLGYTAWNNSSIAIAIAVGDTFTETPFKMFKWSPVWDPVYEVFIHTSNSKTQWRDYNLHNNILFLLPEHEFNLF